MKHKMHNSNSSSVGTQKNKLTSSWSPIIPLLLSVICVAISGDEALSSGLCPSSAAVSLDITSGTGC